MLLKDIIASEETAQGKGGGCITFVKQEIQ